MGPPLAAGIAAIAAAIGLLIARYLVSHRRSVSDDRVRWFVCAPMLFSGIGILIVAIVILPTVPVAGLLLLGWAFVHLGIVAVTLIRMFGLARDPGPLGDHAMAPFLLLAIGAPVAIFAVVIWAASQGMG